VGYGAFLKIAAEEYGLRDLHGMDPYPLEHGSILDERWPFAEGSFDVSGSLLGQREGPGRAEGQGLGHRRHCAEEMI